MMPLLIDGLFNSEGSATSAPQRFGTTVQLSSSFGRIVSLRPRTDPAATMQAVAGNSIGTPCRAATSAIYPRSAPGSMSAVIVGTGSDIGGSGCGGSLGPGAL